MDGSVRLKQTAYPKIFLQSVAGLLNITAKLWQQLLLIALIAVISATGSPAAPETAGSRASYMAAAPEC
jgi:hypothetical protein